MTCAAVSPVSYKHHWQGSCLFSFSASAPAFVLCVAALSKLLQGHAAGFHHTSQPHVCLCRRVNVTVPTPQNVQFGTVDPNTGTWELTDKSLGAGVAIGPNGAQLLTATPSAVRTLSLALLDITKPVLALSSMQGVRPHHASCLTMKLCLLARRCISD